VVLIKPETGNLCRRSLLAGLAASAAFAGTAALGNAPATSLRPVLRGAPGGHAETGALDRVLQKGNLRGTTACAVADVHTAEFLETHQGDLGLPPASVAKAITALYALDVLGPDHRFETRVLITGPIADGVVQGDLVLAGGADPTLDTDGLADLADQLAAAGVRGVSGSFLVYDKALPCQPHIDAQQPDHVSYNPSVAGIALNYNRVHLEWRKAGTDYDLTLEARARSHRPAVHRSSNIRHEQRGAPVYLYRDAGRRDDWSVAKSALGAGGGRWLPVRKPALYAGEIFATLLSAQGISLRSARRVDELPGGQVLARRASAPLADMLKQMLKYSTNLTAEMIGAAASVQRGGPLPDLRASAERMNAWAMDRLGMHAPGFVDHSGLGDQSRLSASDMVRGLIATQSEQTLRPLLKSFGLRDAQGRPDKNHPIKVDAKTGTLHFVSGLGGYMTARNGVTLAFAIFSADAPTRAALSREDRESPKGARVWNRRAKTLQQNLIEYWGQRYGG
jgi:D-alanyl-D-alanine carboxypeptidase/D-alanyl-D-alanine-endopeptidase (penicillin-binding protein 4)